MVSPELEPLRALIEDYLTGQIDEPRLRELEAYLRDDPEARREFVRYARLHTDLHFELRAERPASECSTPSTATPTHNSNPRRPLAPASFAAEHSRFRL